MNELMTLISNVGFPIAACVAMFWMYNKQTEAHSNDMATVTKAIESNTAAIEQLTEYIKEDE